MYKLSSNSRWIVAGIASYGGVECGGEGSLSVYTKVSPYLSWVESTIGFSLSFNGTYAPNATIPAPSSSNPSSSSSPIARSPTGAGAYIEQKTISLLILSFIVIICII
jgi:secreted trypsin-like serine protease